jgi:GNAT superfamily N-acetyltransferase
MEFVTLSDRPDLLPEMWGLTDEWPEFMLHDLVADFYFARLLETWRDWTLMALDGETVAERSHCVPFAFGDEVGRPNLPPSGWDAIIYWSFVDELKGRAPNVVGGLEVTISSKYQGRGLAAEMLKSMTGMCSRRGFNDLYIPVRPSQKHNEPHTPMNVYAMRMRDDGLPEDPWLRVHARLGAQYEGVCQTAMSISGTLDEWRTWTGLPFDATGPVIVPRALSPVHVDVEHDHAVYVEPKVWMHNRLSSVAALPPDPLR